MSPHNLKLIVVVGILFISIGIFLPSSIYQMITAQSEPSHWTTGAPIPTPRSEVAGAVLNNKIYIVGGFDSSGRSTSIVEVYDPVTAKWATAPSLPQIGRASCRERV